VNSLNLEKSSEFDMVEVGCNGLSELEEDAKRGYEGKGEVPGRGWPEKAEID
jgi:hypothetical protein